MPALVVVPTFIWCPIIKWGAEIRAGSGSIIRLVGVIKGF